MRGQSLLEVLVALGVSLTVLSVVVLAVITSLQNNNASKNQNMATQYSQEAMELLRSSRDSNWTVFSGLDGNYCLSKGSTTLDANGSSCSTACAKNIDNLFARKICVTPNSSYCSTGNATEVLVTTSWSDSKCQSATDLCHTVELNSCLSSYNRLPTP